MNNDDFDKEVIQRANRYSNDIKLEKIKQKFIYGITRVKNEFFKK